MDLGGSVGSGVVLLDVPARRLFLFRERQHCEYATTTITGFAYEADETAWLETMAQLVAERRCDDLDYENLSEFLTDMARRDKREVFSRLVVLIGHLLKWEYQEPRRSDSWRDTILEQQRELGLLVESGSLRRHAAEVLEKAHQAAVKEVVKQTGLAKETLPSEPRMTLDDLLSAEV